MNSPLYGKVASETAAEENLVCRQIVREISQFGVTQRQLKLVIYLLALELENNQLMLDITSVIKNDTDAVFIASPSEEQHSG